MSKKKNILDNTTFEFLQPGWIIIHAAATVLMITAIKCIIKHSSKS